MTGRSLVKMFAVSMAALAVGIAPMAANAVTAPAFTLTSTTTTAFPSTVLGATSAAQVITLTTTRAVTISSVSIPASVNGYQEFVLGAQSCAANGTTSTASATACTFSVTFAPFYAGVHKATLTITDTTGLVYTVGLTGFGDGPQSVLGPGGTANLTGATEGYTGDGGPATAAHIGLPANIYVDALNNVYIGDYNTSTTTYITGEIRVIYQGGASLACLIEAESPATFGTTAGNGCAGATSAPVAGDIYTIAGDTTVLTGTAQHSHGSSSGVLAASVGATTTYQPTGIAVDPNGNVVIADYGTYTIRVIYVAGDSMACLIEVENPTSFGLSSSATSCAGATSAPIPGYIYTIGGVGSSPGITGDGGKATVALMANVIGLALTPAGDVVLTDDSTQAARTARIRVIYNGGAAMAALIALENPGTTPVLGNIYRLMGGVFASTGDGSLANGGTAGLLYSRGITVDPEGDVVFNDYSATAGTLESKVRVIYYAGTKMANLIALENPGTTARPGYVYTLAGNAGTTGYTGDGGLASAATMKVLYGITLDPAEDIYVTDETSYVVRRISMADGTISTFVGNGVQGTLTGNALTSHLWLPWGIQMGESGTLFVGDYGTYRVLSDSITPYPITYATAIPAGSTSAAQYVYHQNIGTENLTITSVRASTNFTTVSAASSGLTTPYADCAAALVLPPGQTCVVAIEFQPVAGGAITGTMTITDNSSNQAGSTHTVALNGISALQTVTTLSSSLTPTYSGNTVTYTANVSVAPGQNTVGIPPLIGTVAFTDGGVALTGSPVSVDVNGNATISSGVLTPGTHAIKALYTPDPTVVGNYSPSTATLSEVAAGITTQTALTSSTANADPGASVTFTATVSVVAGQTLPPGAPTSLAGTVVFLDGTTPITGSPVAINASGVATLSTSTLAVGTHTITATFTPSSPFYTISTITYTQLVSAPGYTVTENFAGLAMVTGGSVAAPFTLTAVGGYAGTIKGYCTGLPAYINCTYSPSAGATFTGDGTQTYTVKFVSESQTISMSRTNGAVLAGLLGIPLLLLARRRKLGAMLAVLLLMAATVGISGCNTVKDNPAVGTFGVTVNFSDGTTTVSEPVTISVTGTSWPQ